jgi:hypothetical protein
MDHDVIQSTPKNLEIISGPSQYSLTGAKLSRYNQCWYYH